MKEYKPQHITIRKNGEVLISGDLLEFILIQAKKWKQSPNVTFNRMLKKGLKILEKETIHR